MEATVYGDRKSSFVSRAGCMVEITTHYILNYNEQIGIVGSGTGLGNWQADAAITAVKYSWGYWTVRVELDQGQRHEYKWVVIDKDSKTIIRWQEGENREIEIEVGLKELKIDVPWTEEIIDEADEENREIEIETGIKELKNDTPWTGEIIDEACGENRQKYDGKKELKIDVDDDDKDIAALSSEREHRSQIVKGRREKCHQIFRVLTKIYDQWTFNQ